MAFMAWFAVGMESARAGMVTGVVVDDAEVPLPGIDVVLTAADGARIEAETDASVQVRAELPAGTATITVTGDGFGPGTLSVAAPDVGDVSWVLHLHRVEVESTTRGEVMTREFIQNIPTGRSYQAATQMAAGVLAGSGNNPNMAGGATNESYDHPGNHPRGPLVKVSARAEPSGREAAATESSFALGVPEARGSWAAASDSLQWATATATFAEVLRGSPHEAETTWGQVLALVDDAAQTDRQDHAELRSLVERATQLSGGLDALPAPNGVRPAPPRSFTRR